MKLLSVQNLKKQYPGFTLDNVSFDVEEGSIMGFIGRNGAGKTTTIKSVLNLVHADSGEVLFEGQDLWANETACKKRIGLVLGEFNYYKRKKLKAIAAVTKQFYEDWDEETYQALLSRFSLDPEKKISELSQGMTLQCGTIIATGTPAGVAMGMNPPVWLKSGDKVCCEIEKIGVLRNQFKAE